MFRNRLSLVLVAVAALAWAGPDTEGTAAGQSVADALRDFAKTDVAFVAAGQLRTSANDDLVSQIQYPSDEIAVVKLTGKQLRAALERAVSLYPSPNPGFLQVSGLEVSFRARGGADARITAVSVNGGALDAGRTYTVAMPGSLARGGLGYFTVWEKNAIERTISGATLESVLKGKTVGARPSRWKLAD